MTQDNTRAREGRQGGRSSGRSSGARFSAAECRLCDMGTIAEQGEGKKGAFWRVCLCGGYAEYVARGENAF